MTAIHGKLLNLIVLGLLCGAGAYCVRIPRDPVHGVDISPSFVEFVEQPFEGESVKVPFQMSNRSSTEVVLQEIQASCSCTSVVTRDGKTLDAPLPVPPGESIPWQATIHTGSRYGEQKFHINFVILANGRKIERPVSIQMSVRAGWRSDPYEIVLRDLVPGATFAAEADLYDGDPTSGIPLKDVLSSSPELIQVRSDEVNHSERSVAYPLPFQHRYRLVVTGTAPSEHGRSFQTDILVSSTNKNAPEMRIPVRGRTRDKDYQLFPAELEIIAADSRAGWKRVIDCQVRSTAFPLPTEVVRKPDFLNIQIIRENDLLARVEVKSGNGFLETQETGKFEIVLGASGQELLTIPVIIVR